MAISFRMGVALQGTSGGSVSLNPGTDPSTDDVLVCAFGESTTSAGPSGASISGNTFGGTWTTEHSVVWATRRRLFVSVNDDWSTASGTANVNESGNNNQDAYGGLLIVEGSDGGYTEDDVGGDESGTFCRPTLTTGHDGYIVILQMEDNPGGIAAVDTWTRLDWIEDADGLRNLTVFVHVGEPADLTPTFTWTGNNGFTFWTAYFDAAAGGPDVIAADSAAVVAAMGNATIVPTAVVAGGSAAVVSAMGNATVVPTAVVAGDTAAVVSAMGNAELVTTPQVAGDTAAVVSAMGNADVVPTAVVAGDTAVVVAAMSNANVVPTPSLAGDSAVVVAAMGNATVSTTPQIAADGAAVVSAMGNAQVIPTAIVAGDAAVVSAAMGNAQVIPTPAVAGDAMAIVTVMGNGEVTTLPTLEGDTMMVVAAMGNAQIVPTPQVAGDTMVVVTAMGNAVVTVPGETVEFVYPSERRPTDLQRIRVRLRRGRQSRVITPY